jgi:hypothetical protein
VSLLLQGKGQWERVLMQLLRELFQHPIKILPDACAHWAALVVNSRKIAKHPWVLMANCYENKQRMGYRLCRDFKKSPAHPSPMQGSLLPVPGVWSANPSLSTASERSPHLTHSPIRSWVASWWSWDGSCCGFSLCCGSPLKPPSMFARYPRTVPQRAHVPKSLLQGS